MQHLRLAGLQYPIEWCDWEANRVNIDAQIDALAELPDLLILPEMFTSGFTDQPEPVAQTMDGPAVEWMVQLASRHQMICLGSMVVLEDSNYYNRLVVAFPEGTASFYDKRHLFSYAGEHEKFSAGEHRLIFTCKGWRICPLICYDLRFPVWSRNNDAYDLLIYVANWPSPRVDAWTSLLKARAIENQAVVFGLNRTGVDGNQISYPGRSQVYDASGQIIAECAADPKVMSATLKYDELIDFRARYNFLQDQDSYIIE